jgi:hypothetical protein
VTAAYGAQKPFVVRYIHELDSFLWSHSVKRLITAIRWTARLWSIPSIVALLLPYFVEGFYWMHADSLREVIGHLCFFAVLAGLIVAWRWEVLGGGLTVGGMGVFYVTWWFHGKLPRGPFFLLIAAPGLLFILCWLLARRIEVANRSEVAFRDAGGNDA